MLASHPRSPESPRPSGHVLTVPERSRACHWARVSSLGPGLLLCGGGARSWTLASARPRHDTGPSHGPGRGALRLQPPPPSLRTVVEFLEHGTNGTNGTQVPVARALRATCRGRSEPGRVREHSRRNGVAVWIFDRQYSGTRSERERKRASLLFYLAAAAHGASLGLQPLVSSK